MNLITSVSEPGIPIINCTSSEEIITAYERTLSCNNLTVIGGGAVGIEVRKLF